MVSLYYLLVLAFSLQASADQTSSGWVNLAKQYDTTGNGANTKETTLRADWSTNPAKTLSVAQFNSSLGTLTSITVEYAYYLGGTFYIKNNSANNVSFTYTATLTGGSALKDPFNLQIANLSKTLTASKTLSAGTSDKTVWTDASGSLATSSKTYNSGNTTLSNWTGNGNMVFTVTGYDIEGWTKANSAAPATVYWSNEASPFGNGVYSYSALKVTYDYTPVPEPSTMAGFLACLPVGILIMRKKRG